MLDCVTWLWHLGGSWGRSGAMGGVVGVGGTPNPTPLKVNIWPSTGAVYDRFPCLHTRVDMVGSLVWPSARWFVLQNAGAGHGGQGTTIMGTHPSDQPHHNHPSMGNQPRSTPQTPSIQCKSIPYEHFGSPRPIKSHSFKARP